MSGKSKDFLVRRQEKEAPAEEAKFAYFGPPHAEDRFRFVIAKEDGDTISIVPGEGRFKRGLIAWRWEEAEGGESTPYVTEKTNARRIDLRRLTRGDA